MKIYAHYTTILYYITTFLLIFGPKIGGYIDISMITSIIIILISFKKIKIYDSLYVRLLCLLFCIILYSTIIMCFTKIDAIFIGKFIRSFLSLISIYTFYSTPSIGKKKTINILINILLLHAIIVIISSLFFIELQNHLKLITNFTLAPNYFRSTGLTNGYDFSGILCIFGLLLTGFLPKNIVNNNIVKLIIFIIATIFTSRVNMLVLEVIIAYMILMSKNMNKKIKFLICTVLLITIIPVLGLVLYSTGYQDNIIINFLLDNSFFAESANKIVYYYATSDINQSIASHFDFNRLTELQLLFGSMQIANQDPGYTQYIYSVGIMGTAITISFYAQILAGLKRKNSKAKNTNTYYFKKVIIVIVVLCLVMSFKNSYLLARHVTEIILIILTIFTSLKNESER